MAGSAGTVPPGEGEIVGGIFGGRKTVVHLVCLGMAKAIGSAAVSLDPQWIGKIERLKRGIEDMNPHVAQCAAAEIKNLPPLTRVIHLFGEMPNGCGTQPTIPVQRFGHGGFFGERFAVITPVFERPHVNLFDFSDDAFLDVVPGKSVGRARLVLDAHLGGEIFLRSKFGQLARLGQFVGERFLGVDVLAELHRGHGGRVMGVIRCGDGNHINLVSESREHLSVVLEKLGALVLRKPGVDLTAISIRITKANGLHTLMLDQFAGVHAALATGTNVGGANTAVGRVGKQPGRQDKKAACGS